MIKRSRAVKLTSFKNAASKNVDSFSVKFFISPELTTSGSANYAEISEIRQPSSILIYTGSASRTYTINGKFLARTIAEADVAFRNRNLLESWRVPNSTIGDGGEFKIFNKEEYIGKAEPQKPNDIPAIQKQDAVDMEINPEEEQFTPFQSLGSLFEGTPEVLLLEGYGAQFRKIPVVITSLSFTFPSDVDYIESTKGALVPILQDVSISLKEAREVTSGAASISKFNLSKFKEGTLEYW